MTSPRLRALFATLLAAVLASCGGGDICLNCSAVPTPTPGPGNTVTVDGTIRQLSNGALLSSVVVWVCLDLPEDQNDFNECPGIFTTEVASDGAFSRTNISEGAIRIAFWIDSNEDFMIDPGEPFAELDTTVDLSDVREGQTVTVSEADVNFTTMIATASVSVNDTPTPTPASTPTPTPF